MNDWKQKLALAGGYLAVFLVVLIFSLYLTFDANALKPLIEDAARKNNLEFQVEDISLTGILGLEMKKMRIAPIKTGDQEPQPPLVIDRLVISPRLSTLIGLISSPPGGKGKNPPPLAFSFEAGIGPGKIEGSYQQKQNQVHLDTTVKDLPAQSTMVSYYISDLELTGKMSGECVLDLEDKNRPDTWNGKLAVDLEAITISDFTYMGFQIGGFDVQRGTLIANIEAGLAKINPLKLQSQDVPVSLTGSMALKNPIRKSIIDLKGSLKVSDAYKEKNPLIGGILPPTDNYSYQGTVDGILPGI